ncbi:MAG: DNA mismatch repair endonuclease MutL, partial [Cyanobacteria bacterium P01_A01_bin.83]
MASEIQTLPDEVIDLIAAGEVIDSLAAVIRELVENALDAGASRIAIALNPQLWQVQVADNGTGMLLEDLRVCAKPHSTSKIRTQQDLWHITSLGFRGEALHSIAQVADLTICSRAKHPAAMGWKVTYQKAQATQESLVAIATGTIVTVSNLFARIPVRRRALPPLPQQLKEIQKLIQQIALCHPQITWQVKQQHNSWFNISPGATAKDI